MTEVFDCSDSSQLLAGMRSARQALGRAQLAVIPTDTVYGIAADAFSAAGVRKLLTAKGRTAQSPPPVLIAGIEQLDALSAQVPAPVRQLADDFWPGALTIVLTANPALSWHLGETGGTVALRIPDQELTLELLRETGPLAVSSANKTGEPAARTSDQAHDALGESVRVYLDAGETPGDGLASTIVDATAVTDDGGELRVLREGAISTARIAAAIPEVTVLTPTDIAAVATAEEHEDTATEATMAAPDAADTPREARPSDSD